MPELRVALFTGNYNHIKDGVSLTLNRLAGFLLDRSIPLKIFGPTVEKPQINHVGDFHPVASVSAPGRPEYRISTGFPGDARKALLKFKPTLIHVATPDILGFKALRFANKYAIPLVSSYHTHFTSYLKYYHLNILEPLGWKYLQWYYSQCIHTYVPSPSMKDVLRSHGISNGLKIWARGVNTKRFSPEKRTIQWRQKHGFDPEDCIVTFISRLVWEKNLSVYIDAVKQMESKDKRIKALIVGDGPARNQMQEMLPEGVFTGFLDGNELAKAYAGSDLFLFPSDTETFGNVTLEAMASGLPVLVADATGSRSLVEDGVNGYTLPAESAGAFADKALSIISSKKRMEAMSRSSRQMAQKYSWENVNKQLLEYYHEALQIEHEAVTQGS